MMEGGLTRDRRPTVHCDTFFHEEGKGREKEAIF